MRKNTTDLVIFAQIFFDKDYQLDINIDPKLIIDAGANVGYASLWFNYKYPKAKIIAIEPEQSNFKVLEQNTGKHANIKSLNKGLWPSKTFLKIISRETGECGFGTAEAGQGNDFDVETITIKEILEQTQSDQIDILKIDIEGAEKDLFLKNYESWLDKVKILIIELHDQITPGANNSFYNAIKNYNWHKYYQGENIILIRK